MDIWPASGDPERVEGLTLLQAGPGFPALQLQLDEIWAGSNCSIAAIPENWPGSPALAGPSTAYGQAEGEVKHLCALFPHQHGLHIVRARCFAFVGPDLSLNAHFPIGNFIRNSLTAVAINVAIDITNLRTFLHQSDLALWLFTLLERGRPGDG